MQLWEEVWEETRLLLMHCSQSHRNWRPGTAHGFLRCFMIHPCLLIFLTFFVLQWTCALSMASSLLQYQSLPNIRSLCTSTACGATFSTSCQLPRAWAFFKSAHARTLPSPALLIEFSPPSNQPRTSNVCSSPPRPSPTSSASSSTLSPYITQTLPIH